MSRTGERWLVIGAYDPFKARSGSALRIRQHLETLKREGAQVFYWGLGEEERKEENARVHRLKPWRSLAPWEKLLQAPRLLLGAIQNFDPNVSFLYRRHGLKDLANTIDRFGPTHLLVSETWMCRYFLSLRDHVVLVGVPSGIARFFLLDGVKVVVDLHNVESRLRTGVRSNLVRRTETVACQKADEVWVCSEVDKEAVFKAFSVQAVVVPNKVRAELYDGMTLSKARTFGMVGIWSYGPNAQAADILLRDVWPEIGRDSVPILVGKDPTVSMRKAYRAHITGEVEDVRPHLQKIRTVVVPLLEGGGTRLKVLEAMAAGIPVVATKKAVEGLEVKHLEHCVITEPDEMGRWIKLLWENTELEEKLRKNARELVREKYSW